MIALGHPADLCMSCYRGQALGRMHPSLQYWSPVIKYGWWRNIFAGGTNDEGDPRQEGPAESGLDDLQVHKAAGSQPLALDPLNVP